MKWYAIMMALVIGGAIVSEVVSKAPVRCAESCRIAGLTMARSTLVECECLAREAN